MKKIMEWWKKRPYWQRYGIIFGVIGLILVFIPNNLKIPIINYYSILPSFLNLIYVAKYNANLDRLIIFFIWLIEFIITGFIVGFIVKKIRKEGFQNFWKKLRYWQKFGIIFAVFTLLIIAKAARCSEERPFCWFLLLFSPPTFIINSINQLEMGVYDLKYVFELNEFLLPKIYTIFIFIETVIIGIVIGLFIDLIIHTYKKLK